MSPEIIELLIRAVITIGTEAAVAIMHAVSSGDKSAVEQLAALMPSADQLALADEAHRIAERKAHGLV